jgi:hypothetical protein
MHVFKEELVHFEEKHAKFIPIFLSKRQDPDPDLTWPKSSRSGFTTLVCVVWQTLSLK